MNGATSYELVGVGGYDPVYYGSRIEVSYSPGSKTGHDNVTNAVFLGGGTGGSSDFSASINHDKQRYAGFVFTVTVSFG